MLHGGVYAFTGEKNPSLMKGFSVIRLSTGFFIFKCYFHGDSSHWQSLLWIVHNSCCLQQFLGKQWYKWFIYFSKEDYFTPERVFFFFRNYTRALFWMGINKVALYSWPVQSKQRAIRVVDYVQWRKKEDSTSDEFVQPEIITTTVKKSPMCCEWNTQEVWVDVCLSAAVIVNEFIMHGNKYNSI